MHSEIGKGTSFKVYFPKADAPEQVVEAPSAARPHAGAETVLIVDDEEALRMLAKRLLGTPGLPGNDRGKRRTEALLLFEANPSIDVLLTDVVMPGASGPELTRRLVEQRPSLRGSDLYVRSTRTKPLSSTESSSPESAFLHKPFTSETLGRKIREVLER